MSFSHAGELPHGLHLDIPSAVYHAPNPSIASKSALDVLDRSPAHLQAWLTKANDPGPAMLFGSALHLALLEPDVYATTYVVEPSFGDCRFKANKAARDEWRADHEGRTLLEAEDDEAIRGMCAAVRAHPLASKLVTGGSAEVTIRWQDAETGLECKARADYYRRALRMGVDVKTTDDARAHAFRMSCAKYRYHVQDAFYRDGFAAVGAPLDHFVFLAIEKTAPYAIALHSLDMEALAKGAAAARRNLATFAECLRTGVYPGYDTSIQTLDLPAWA